MQSIEAMQLAYLLLISFWDVDKSNRIAMLIIFYLPVICVSVFMFTPDVDTNIEFYLHDRMNHDLSVAETHCQLPRKKWKLSA